jgi:hypothetical protein
MAKKRKKPRKKDQKVPHANSPGTLPVPPHIINSNESTKEAPPTIKWCRGIGLLSILGGGASMVQPSSFWIGTGFVYLGLLLLAVDLYFEPHLGRMFKIVGWTVAAALLGAFSHFWVFVPAPLGLGANSYPIEFPPGTVIGGIQWRAGAERSSAAHRQD